MGNFSCRAVKPKCSIIETVKDHETVRGSGRSDLSDLDMALVFPSWCLIVYLLYAGCVTKQVLRYFC
jgi:hypothetical protein